MNCSIKPGYVYILRSAAQPNRVKIGLAKSVEDRQFALSLGDPDLEVHSCLFFLDMHSAEAHMHSLFASKRIVREHFEVTAEEAHRELERLHKARQDEFNKLTAEIRWMVDKGEIKLDTAEDSLVCEGSALSTVLAHVPDAKDGRNVKMLTAVALNGGLAGRTASALLSKAGLTTYIVDNVVLFDRSKSSKMERIFKGKACFGTWRTQLSKFAGLLHTGKVMPITTWLDKTEADVELIDRVSPCTA